MAKSTTLTYTNRWNKIDRKFDSSYLFYLIFLIDKVNITLMCTQPMIYYMLCNGRHYVGIYHETCTCVCVYVPFFKTGFWKQCFRDEKYEINVVVSIAFTLPLLCENKISRIICKWEKLESDRRVIEVKKISVKNLSCFISVKILSHKILYYLFLIIFFSQLIDFKNIFILTITLKILPLFVIKSRFIREEILPQD